MSKKRVHELGKQLKEQGIELSNNELVDKLHALGYTDVKSHSSSLEDDQAQTAFERIIGERKPKPAPVKPSGPGFVVRKKAHTEPVAPPAHAPAAPAAVAAPAPQPHHASEPAAAPPGGGPARVPRPPAGPWQPAARPGAGAATPMAAAPHQPQSDTRHL